ncbi:MAG: hypothetical protein M0R70_12590 [Nitrospirae bacterium]|nr:hypothetical protein [Nitrospirota bacterium]
MPVGDEILGDGILGDGGVAVAWWISEEPIYSFPSLSTSPLVDPWEEQAAMDLALRSEKEAGYTQTRARFTRVPYKYHIEYGDLSQADKDALKVFEIGLKVGTDKFTHPDIGTANVRLMGAIQYQPAEPYGYWTAAFDVEEA